MKGERELWLEKRVEGLERADKFVRLLVSKSSDADPSDYEEVLSDPEFWATDYAHAMSKLERVEELEQRCRAGVLALLHLNDLLTTAEAEVARLIEIMKIANAVVETSRVDREQAEAEVARLRGLLAEWIPRHSAACCTPTPELGSFPPGPFLPKWCVCEDLSKRSRAALATEVK